MFLGGVGVWKHHLNLGMAWEGAKVTRSIPDSADRVAQYDEDRWDSIGITSYDSIKR
jgi:hypothetical protein